MLANESGSCHVKLICGQRAGGVQHYGDVRRRVADGEIKLEAELLILPENGTNKSSGQHGEHEHFGPEPDNNSS